MGVFTHEYPYTDYHEMNLDWVIKKIKELNSKMDEFTAITKIVPRGLWNITTQYPAWSLVEYDNEGYISLQPVPSGVQITDNNYWLKISEYTSVIADLADRIQALEGAIPTIENDIDTLDTRVGVVEGDITTINGNIDDLTDDVGDNTIAINNLANTVETNRYNIFYKGKNLVIFGDSWSDLNTLSVQPDKRYCSMLAVALGMTQKNFAVGGSGFTPLATYQIYDQITDAENTLSDEDKANTGAVIFLGGVNDLRHGATPTASPDSNGIIYNAKACVTAAATMFPNAIIFFAGLTYMSGEAADRASTPPDWEGATTYGWRNYSYKVVNALKEMSGIKLCVLDDIGDALTFNPDAYGADRLHPNILGHQILFGEFRNVMLGNRVKRSRYIGTVFTLDTTKVDWDSFGYIFQIGELTVFTGGSLKCKVSFSGSTSTQIGTYHGPLLRNTSMAFDVREGNQYFGTVAIGAKSGAVQFRPEVTFAVGETFYIQPLVFIGEHYIP